MKTFLTTAAVGLALAVGYAGGYYRATAHGIAIAPGSTLVSMADDTVSYLSFTSKAWAFTAQRSRAGGDYLVQATFADGRPAQQCTAAANLNGLLANFTELTARRALAHPTQSLAEFPVDMGFLDVRTANIEPQEPLLLATNREGNALAVKTYGYAAEITLPVAVIRTLEQGCPAVTASSAGAQRATR